jgi:hypothetical protein
VPILPLLAFIGIATVAAALFRQCEALRAAEVPLVLAMPSGSSPGGTGSRRSGPSQSPPRNKSPDTTERSRSAFRRQPFSRAGRDRVAALAISMGPRGARDFALKGDDFYYHWQANALADGLGFINPLT